MKFIDAFLNQITMYKLALYYLAGLIGVAALLSFLGILQFNGLDIILSSLIVVAVCYVTNYILAKMFKAVTNTESVYITALILTLIIPTRLPVNLMFLIGASAVAMAAKYLLTIEKRHIFNPVAVSVVAISLLSPEHAATWWVGTPLMLPFVLMGGFLLLRKIQRWKMVLIFLATYLLIIGAGSLLVSGSLMSVITLWQKSILYSPVFFFSFVMLTEPLTSPATEKQRENYSVVTALFFATPQLRFISIGLTPEMALCLGNIFSYLISPNYRLDLVLKSKLQLSRDTFLFGFQKPKGFNFIPGQYMEWTLPHSKPDSRGNRRYFSISSSPTENEITMTVKFYDKASSYKKELLNLQSSKQIVAAQVAGDFVLPQNLKAPLVLIAGGVGIAPFRSMIQYIIDKGLTVDIVLIFTNRIKADILFSDVFKRAEGNGVKTIYNLTDVQNIPQDWQGSTGYITAEKIKQLIPDFQNRFYYLSGPQLMVQNFEGELLKAGIAKKQIKTDFFPGYSEK
ncbi:MAG: oxidoreductase [Candidatus Levyibacteriota bacterium]|jgi:ferredoxin-NADP reductase/Na+-translocating ferredoxin:NAD+ oxidoreductase RnfD subunit